MSIFLDLIFKIFQLSGVCYAWESLRYALRMYSIYNVSVSKMFQLVKMLITEGVLSFSLKKNKKKTQNYYIRAFNLN